MSVEDAKRAVDIGCTGIMVSNHGGRQLDGSRASQLAEICDAVGDQIDVVCEVVFGEAHVLKALSVGASGFWWSPVSMRSLQRDNSGWNVRLATSRLR